MNNKNGLIAAIVGLSLLLGWLLFGWAPDPQGSHGEIAAKSGPTGGDFTLTSADGPLALERFRGKVVLLYFGYTWCPDICPTALAMMSQALAGMAEEELVRVQGIFVSVDPERDDVARLKEYTAYFHPSIVGATGSVEEVARVAALYGAAYSKAPGESAEAYTVDHSSYTYVIDPAGRLRASLPHGTFPDRIRAEVRGLLAGE